MASLRDRKEGPREVEGPASGEARLTRLVHLSTSAFGGRVWIGIQPSKIWSVAMVMHVTDPLDVQSRLMVW